MESYKSVFKEKIITPLIEDVFPNSKYTPKVGISTEEYKKGQWERYDRYSSEDKIITDINIKAEDNQNLSLVISEVHAEERHKDDGKVSYVTIFRGLSGYVNLPKDIGCYIRLCNNEFGLFGTSEDRLELDMTEFEKVFDVKTDDKIKAMQILTTDIMTELIDLVKTSKVKFEIYLNHDIMHIRFHTGKMFEPEVFGELMQLDELKELKECFYKIEAVKNVTEHICNVVYNTEL